MTQLISERIAERRKDKAFMDRIKASVKRNRKILERLKHDDPAPICEWKRL